MTEFSHKRVTVLGLNSSGFYSARLLHDLGARVFVSECKETARIRQYAKELAEFSIPYEIGGHTQKKIQESDCVVLSPGIALNAEPVQWARQRNIPVMSEIELAYRMCPAYIIAITGTNGKTTVTTLIGDVLKKAQKNVFVAGNIGTPFTAVVQKMKAADYVSLEMSSFQLETIHNFHPRISVLLNFTPDHLDRYANLDEYLSAKKRIFLNQTKNDTVILNYADETLRRLANDVSAHVVFFNAEDAERYPQLNPNELAVMKVAEAVGIDVRMCQDVFSHFEGVEHRLEYVRTLRGVEIINDSKATNIDSTRWALSTLEKPIVLIAGGRDKGADFTVLRDLFKRKVKSLVVFGEAKRKIHDALSSVVSVEECNDITEALQQALAGAAEGECVLFSPMCASFDMFTNFEERGCIFKEIVHAL